jgi:flagellar biosynthetic protein FliO
MRIFTLRHGICISISIKSLFGALNKMTAGKIKLVVILALLVVIGGLLPVMARVWAAPDSEQQNDSSIPPAPSKVEGPAPEPIQTNNSDLQPQTQQYGIPGGREFFYKMLLSISLVVALSFAAIYVSKKLLPKLANHQGKQIRVIETTYIAPRKGIHLVQIGSRRLLLASTSESVTMLADVTEPAASFAAALEARS